MDLSAFLDPINIQDTPRLFTAIAEWLAVFVYFNIYKRKYHGKIFVFQCVAVLLIQTLFQFIAGLLPLYLWIVAMIGAVGIMYLALYLVLDIKPKDCGVIATHAFVLAEFAASLYKQFFVWYIIITEREDIVSSFAVMAVIFAMTYVVFYHFEKDNISSVYIDGFNLTFILIGNPEQV